MRNHGFTLVELMIAMVIIGLMAAVIAPSFVAGAESRLDMVGVQVRDALARASSLARSTREPHAVVFDVGTNRLAVVDNQGRAVTDPLTRRPFVIDFRRPDQPQGIEIHSVGFGTDGQAAIFDGRGLPLQDGSIVLRCRDAVRTLLLDKASGQLSVP